MRFQLAYSLPRFNLSISHFCLGIGQSPFFHSQDYFIVDFLAFFLLVFLHYSSPRLLSGTSCSHLTSSFPAWLPPSQKSDAHTTRASCLTHQLQFAMLSLHEESVNRL